MTVLRLDAMDEYDIISQIGQGTFSAVYQVQHKATHRAYAMKVLKSKCPSIEQAEHNEELQFMEALGFHPNVIVLHDAIFETSVGRLSFFIDLMDQSLADLLQDRRESLPVNEALLLIYQLLSALEHVHEAVIAAGEKESGITIHHVNGQYDEGDIIFQARCPISPDDTPDDIARKVHELEYEHYPWVIEQLWENS